MKKNHSVAFAGAALLVASGLLGPVAHAQSRYFNGLSVGLGVTSTESKIDDVFGSTTSTSNTDANGVLQVQYSLAAGDSFLVGFGGTANLGNLKAGSFGPNTITLKDGYTLYVVPGYAD